MKKTLFKVIAVLSFIIIMSVGMVTSFQKKADAASRITIKWDGNGGKNNQGQSYHYTYHNTDNNGVVKVTPSSTLYKKSGYTLTGFKIGSITYSIGSSVKLTKDTTIVFQWKHNDVTVSFSGGLGRNHNSITVPYGTTVEKAMSLGGISAAKDGYHRKYNENSSNGSQLYDNTKIKKNMTIVVNAERNTGLLNIRNIDGQGTTRSFSVHTGQKITDFVSTLSWHVPQLQDYYLFALKDDNGNYYYSGEENFAPLLCVPSQGGSIWLTACWIKAGEQIPVTFTLDKSTVDYLYYNHKSSAVSQIIKVLLQLLYSDAASKADPLTHALASLVKLIPSDQEVLASDITRWHTYLDYKGQSYITILGYFSVGKYTGAPEFHIFDWN